MVSSSVIFCHFLMLSAATFRIFHAVNIQFIVCVNFWSKSYLCHLTPTMSNFRDILQPRISFILGYKEQKTLNLVLSDGTYSVFM
jgi:hypothetical protein